MLKALILDSLSSPRDRESVLRSFRGNRGHDYDWLRDEYLGHGGAKFPSAINQHFLLLNDWSTDLRYNPRNVRVADADSFFQAVEAIMQWAQERI